MPSVIYSMMPGCHLNVQSFSKSLEKLAGSIHHGHSPMEKQSPWGAFFRLHGERFPHGELLIGTETMVPMGKMSPIRGVFLHGE